MIGKVGQASFTPYFGGYALNRTRVKKHVENIIIKYGVSPDKLIKHLKRINSKYVTKDELKKRADLIKDHNLKKAARDVIDIASFEADSSLVPVTIGEIIALIVKLANEFKDFVVSFTKVFGESMQASLETGLGAVTAEKSSKLAEALGSGISGGIMCITGFLQTAMGFNQGILDGKKGAELGALRKGVPEVEEEIDGANIGKIGEDAEDMEEVENVGENLESVPLKGKAVLELEEQPKEEEVEISFEPRNSQVGRSGTFKTEEDSIQCKSEIDKEIRMKEIESKYSEKASKFGAGTAQSFYQIGQAFGGITECISKFYSASYNAKAGTKSSYKGLLDSRKQQNQSLVSSTMDQQKALSSDAAQALSRWISSCATPG